MSLHNCVVMKTHLALPNTSSFVASIDENEMHILFKEYHEGLYDDLLPKPSRPLSPFEQRDALHRYLVYYLFEEGAADGTERNEVLIEFVVNGNKHGFITRLTQEQFFQEPLYRMV